MVVVLHVGLHKTGSTWLQREVFPYLEGIGYVSHHATRRYLAAIVAGDPPPPAPPQPDATDLVWSYEGMAGPLWDPIEPELAAERLATHFPGARILLFTRDPDEWRTSVYAQYVHEGGFLAPEDFWRTVPVATTGTDTPRVVAAFEQRFPAVHVFAYEALQESPVDMATAVAAACGTTLSQPVATTVHNRALARPTQWILRTTNRWFRRSRFNPSPPLPTRGAARIRRGLQRYVDPRIPDRWR